MASRSSCRFASQGASVTLGFGAVHDSYETKQQALEAQSRTKQAKMAENAIFFSLCEATVLYIELICVKNTLFPVNEWMNG